MRIQGHLAARCRNATDHGPSGRDRAPTPSEVSSLSYSFLWEIAVKMNRRFMSTPVGFRYLYDAGYIDREMDMWFDVCVLVVVCDSLVNGIYYRRNGISTMSYKLRSSFPKFSAGAMQMTTTIFCR